MAQQESKEEREKAEAEKRRRREAGWKAEAERRRRARPREEREKRVKEELSFLLSGEKPKFITPRPEIGYAPDSVMGGIYNKEITNFPLAPAQAPKKIEPWPNARKDAKLPMWGGGSVIEDTIKNSMPDIAQSTAATEDKPAISEQQEVATPQAITQTEENPYLVSKEEIDRLLKEQGRNDQAFHAVNDAMTREAKHLAERLRAYNQANSSGWADSDDYALLSLAEASGGPKALPNNSSRLAAIQSRMLATTPGKAAISEEAPLNRVSPYYPKATSAQEADAVLIDHLEPGALDKSMVWDGFKKDPANIISIGNRTLKAIAGQLSLADHGKLNLDAPNNGIESAAGQFLRSVKDRTYEQPGLDIAADKNAKRFGINRYINGYKDAETGETIVEPIDLTKNKAVRDAVIGDIKSILKMSPLFTSDKNIENLRSLVRKTTLSGSGGDKGNKSYNLDPESVVENILTALAERLFWENLRNSGQSQIKVLEDRTSKHPEFKKGKLIRIDGIKDEKAQTQQQSRVDTRPILE